MNGLGSRIALVVGSLAAALVGWFVARQFGDEEPAAVITEAIALYDCPTSGGAAIGSVSAGDRVWLIGITDDRWAVVRHPDRPDVPAWVPLALVDTAADDGDLPELTCAAAVGAANTSPATSDVVTTIGGPGTTAVATTTTLPIGTTSTSTTTTLVTDNIPPTVVVTADREHLYVTNEIFPCNLESILEVAIAVADPTLPVAIRSIIATWDSPAGPQTANLNPAGGNRFRLQVLANGPASGETPLTLTATGSDGAGNIGTGLLVVSLRNPASFGCV